MGKYGAFFKNSVLLQWRVKQGHERVSYKIVRRDISVLFDKTCLKVKMPCAHTQTYTHTHTHAYIYIYIYIYIYVCVCVCVCARGIFTRRYVDKSIRPWPTDEKYFRQEISILKIISLLVIATYLVMNIIDIIEYNSNQKSDPNSANN